MIKQIEKKMAQVRLRKPQSQYKGKHDGCESGAYDPPQVAGAQVTGETPASMITDLYQQVKGAALLPC